MFAMVVRVRLDFFFFNSWVSMQAFHIVCEFLPLTPTPEVFLHFYSSRPDKRCGRLSFISRSRACLLSPFTFSYKNFKGEFFKILIEETRKKYFYDENVPKFAFYWTNSPLKLNSWLRHSMKPKDLQVLSVLDHLSHKLPTYGLL